MDLESKKEALVIDYFVNNNDNRVVVIAEKFEMQKHRVHQIINKYLNRKRKNVATEL